MTRALDLTGLPPEVLKQLRLGAHFKQSEMILSALASLGGTATTDELLIAVWRANKVVIKRISLQATLGSLAYQGKIQRIYHGTWQVVQ